MTTKRDNCLKTLGLTDKSADKSAIRKAYLALALTCHPDKQQQHSNSNSNSNSNSHSVDAGRQFRLITEAYNYLMDSQYPEDNPYTFSVIVMETMVSHYDGSRVDLQILKYVISYYRKVDKFARMLFRNSHDYLFDRVRSHMQTMLTYQLHYYDLDNLFKDDGYLNFTYDCRGFLQHLPTDDEEVIVTATATATTSTYGNDNSYSHLQMDCYLESCDKLVALIAGKLDIFDSNNLVDDNFIINLSNATGVSFTEADKLTLMSIRLTNSLSIAESTTTTAATSTAAAAVVATTTAAAADRRKRIASMTDQDKIAVLTRYCLKLPDGVTELPQPKVDNILFRYKF